MSWRVVVTLGGTLTVESSSEDPEPEPSYTGLLAPLRITRSVSGDLWPTQPDIASATVSLLLADPEPRIRQGAPVTIDVYAPYDAVETIERFEGRISEATAVPALDDRLAYTLTCVDYLADLAEPQIVQAEDWPTEASDARLRRLFALSAVGAPSIPAGMTAEGYTSPARILAPTAASPSSRSLAERVEDTLTAWVSGMGSYPGGGPDEDGGRWVLTGRADLSFEVMHKRPASGVYVFELDPVDALWRPRLDLPEDPERMVLIDAGRVDRSAEWSLVKSSGVNAVQLRGPDDPITGAPLVVARSHGVTPVITAAREDVDAPAEAMETAAIVYLPDLSSVTWQPSTYSWLYYAEEEPPVLPALGDAVVVDGALRAWSPAPTYGGVIVGQLTARTLSISSGRPVVEFATRWPQRATDALRWVDLDPALLVEDLDPDLSAVDFRLVRSAA